jgi:hypothetical protein
MKRSSPARNLPGWYGLRKLAYGPATQIRRDGHIPLIDVGSMRLSKEGHLNAYPGIQEVARDGILFSDGKQEHLNAVILATVYRPRVNNFLQVAGVYDKDGRPLTTGCESKQKGLYFCGYYVLPTGMLREIAVEAKQISAKIAAKKR